MILKNFIKNKRFFRKAKEMIMYRKKKQKRKRNKREYRKNWLFLDSNFYRFSNNKLKFYTLDNPKYKIKLRKTILKRKKIKTNFKLKKNNFYNLYLKSEPITKRVNKWFKKSKKSLNKAYYKEVLAFKPFKDNNFTGSVPVKLGHIKQTEVSYLYGPTNDNNHKSSFILTYKPKGLAQIENIKDSKFTLNNKILNFLFSLEQHFNKRNNYIMKENIKNILEENILPPFSSYYFNFDSKFKVYSKIIKNKDLLLNSTSPNMFEPISVNLMQVPTFRYAYFGHALLTQDNAVSRAAGPSGMVGDAEQENNKRLLINNLKKYLEVYDYVYSNETYYKNLHLDVTPKWYQSTIKNPEKIDYLKDYLISDLFNKKKLFNNINMFKNIKYELISNYFINKVFLRRFKSFDALAYEQKFYLYLFPYKFSSFINVYKHLFTLNNNETIVKQDTCKAVNTPTLQFLLKTSVNYSIPIHFDYQITVNLFKNLIAEQRKKKYNLLEYSLKGNISNKNKQKLAKVWKYNSSLIALELNKEVQEINSLTVNNYQTAEFKKASVIDLNSYLYKNNNNAYIEYKNIKLFLRNYSIIKSIQKILKLIKLLILNNMKLKASTEDNNYNKLLVFLNKLRLFIDLSKNYIFYNDTLNHISPNHISPNHISPSDENFKLYNSSKFAFNNNRKSLPLIVNPNKNLNNIKTQLIFTQKENRLHLINEYKNNILSQGSLNVYSNLVPSDLKLKNLIMLLKKFKLIRKLKLIQIIRKLILEKDNDLYLERFVHSHSNKFMAANEFYSLAMLGVKDASQPTYVSVQQKYAGGEGVATDYLPLPVSQGKYVGRSTVRFTHPSAGGDAGSYTINNQKSLNSNSKVRKISVNLGLRNFFLKKKRILEDTINIRSKKSEFGLGEIITYNFNKNTRRINTFDSLDFTGSRIYSNVSLILKYIFKSIGGAIISKPLFIFNHNKITIKLFYFISKNIYFFNNNEKSKLFFLWLKNTELLPNNILKSMKKNKNVLAKNPSSRVKWTVLKKFMSKARNKKFKNSLKYKRLTKILFNNNNNYNIIDLFRRELNALTFILENYFNCSIQLELTRLKYPFYNSNILSQLIGLNGRKYGYEQVLNKLFPKIKIRNPKTILTHYDLSPKRKFSLMSYISGIKMRIAGRFYRHRIIPKRTVSTYQRGSLQRGVVNFVECSKYINKSKRGSFCITISLSHIF